jgi:hypothetical protein
MYRPNSLRFIVSHIFLLSVDRFHYQNPSLDLALSMDRRTRFLFELRKLQSQLNRLELLVSTMHDADYTAYPNHTNNTANAVSLILDFQTSPDMFVRYIPSQQLGYRCSF